MSVHVVEPRRGDTHTPRNETNRARAHALDRWPRYAPFVLSPSSKMRWRIPGIPCRVRDHLGFRQVAQGCAFRVVATLENAVAHTWDPMPCARPRGISLYCRPCLLSTTIPSSAGCVPSRKTGPGAVLATTPPEKTAASRLNLRPKARARETITGFFLPCGRTCHVSRYACACIRKAWWWCTLHEVPGMRHCVLDLSSALEGAYLGHRTSVSPVRHIWNSYAGHLPSTG